MIKISILSNVKGLQKIMSNYNKEFCKIHTLIKKYIILDKRYIGFFMQSKFFEYNIGGIIAYLYRWQSIEKD